MTGDLHSYLEGEEELVTDKEAVPIRLSQGRVVFSHLGGLG